MGRINYKSYLDFINIFDQIEFDNEPPLASTRFANQKAYDDFNLSGMPLVYVAHSLNTKIKKSHKHTDFDFYKRRIRLGNKYHNYYFHELGHCIDMIDGYDLNPDRYYSSRLPSKNRIAVFKDSNGKKFNLKRDYTFCFNEMVAELFAAYCCYAYNKPNSMVESKRYMKSFMKRPYWYNKVKQRVLEMINIVNDISVKKFGYRYE